MSPRAFLSLFLSRHAHSHGHAATSTVEAPSPQPADTATHHQVIEDIRVTSADAPCHPISDAVLVPESPPSSLHRLGRAPTRLNAQLRSPSPILGTPPDRFLPHQPLRRASTISQSTLDVAAANKIKDLIEIDD